MTPKPDRVSSAQSSVWNLPARQSPSPAIPKAVGPEAVVHDRRPECPILAIAGMVMHRGGLSNSCLHSSYVPSRSCEELIKSTAMRCEEPI